MIFGESRAKDLYRRVVWGPWRQALEATPDGWELRINRWLGHAASQASRGQQARVRAHMREVFGDDPRVDTWVRDAFATHFANQYVGFSFGKIRADNWQTWLHLEGLSHLDTALREGRGAVLAHPHMGPAQLPLHVLGLLGYDVHQVGGGKPDLELSPTGQWAADTRARLEERIHATLHDGKAYIRPVLRALSSGGVVLSACDGTGGGEELGRRVVRQVCGRDMKLPIFPVWVAQKTRSPVLPLVTIRSTGPGPQHTSLIGAPLTWQRHDDKRADLEAGVDALAAQLERWLTDHPGDWLFWDKWHDGPDGLLA